MCARRSAPISTAFVPERAVLVGVDSGDATWPHEQSMAELERLVQTDGAEVVATLTQRLERAVPRTFIGSGKVEELVRTVEALDANVVVFDDELSPSQQANLERAVGQDVKVIDRTALILDIFGRHATTREGRLQVQLAQLQYVYPRLRGMWSHLMKEKRRGGIGSRFGQGENQLEADRRIVRDRITLLRRELERLETQRSTQRKARWDSGVFRVALAGYTNAGKSTLLNQLTGSAVYAKDELFATLDPTTRALVLPEGRKITLTDTVGFIQKLPTTLVEAFKSTLAEVANADLILLVADVSDPHVDAELDAVREILGQVGAADIAQLVVLNKRDLLPPEDVAVVARANPGAVLVSAAQGTGVDGLLYAIADAAASQGVTMTVRVPYGKGMLVSMLHEGCQIIRESYEGDAIVATARIPKRMEKTFLPYAVE